MQAYWNFAWVTGSRWKLVEASGRNHKRLEVSVESMDDFATSMEAPNSSMERSINLHEKHVYMNKIVQNSWNVRKLYEDTEAFCRKLWNLTEGRTSGSSFSQFSSQKRQDNLQDKKIRAKVCVSCRLSLVLRVACAIQILLSKLEKENMRLYRIDSNTW